MAVARGHAANVRTRVFLLHRSSIESDTFTLASSRNDGKHVREMAIVSL